MQLYYCSLILVHLQRPVSGGLEDHLERRTLLRDCAKMVCGIAKALTDYASSIMSSQCLFIGMYCCMTLFAVATHANFVYQLE